MGPRAKPTPSYPDAATRAQSEALEDAVARRKKLEAKGASTVAVDQEILGLQRKLREGGQLRAGDTLGGGRYLLLEQVGRGGFAFVWKAHDQTNDAVVAIKVLHANLAGDPSRRERFFRGARAMARLEHPAIVKLLVAAEEDGGFHYFIMEYVDGADLHRAVTKGKIPREEVLPLVLKVGEALSLAHGKGLVHRDVKPANILLDEARAPRLTDFDLVGDAKTTGGTRTGDMMGTFGYAAPESLDRPQEVDVRVDVYGLGMTAVFGLYGDVLPTEVFRDAGAFVDRLTCEPSVKTALKRAVEWDRGKRFADMQAFCAALRAAIEQERQRQEPSEQERVEKEPLPRRPQEVLLPSRYAPARPLENITVEPVAPPESPLVPGTGRRRWLILGSIAAVVGMSALGTRVLFGLPSRRDADDIPGSTASPTPPAPTASVEVAVVSATPATLAACFKGMARIDSGTFQMGSDHGYKDEEPVHEVMVSSFCLDETEVTVDAYAACVKSGKCSADHLSEDRLDSSLIASSYCNYKVSERGDHPINCVSWEQASAYCAAQAKRLPTEEEWEYAARGGSEQRTYPWGSAAPSNQLCWNGEGSDLGIWHRRNTCKVGQYKKGDSLWGVHDMVGNVWEWTDSRYCTYPPRGINNNCTSERHVVRGGSWSNYDTYLFRAANRNPRLPMIRSEDIGFRCARTL